MAGEAPPMARTPGKGRFITFEGGEGSGKSTQVRRLAARLSARGIDTIATREPGGSREAERLRRLLLSGAIAPFGPAAEALVFTAARIDHIDKTIRPALDEGCYVICDRYTDSTRAYQGASGKVDIKLIDELETVASADTRPDITFILDLPVAAGLARAEGRGAGVDRFEQEEHAFHDAVRACFMAIAKADPDRCVIIDASLPPDDVENAIWAAVESRLLPAAPSKKTAGSARKLRIIRGSAQASLKGGAS